MNSKMLRNLLGALVALILTSLTTQTIVSAAPRPYLVVASAPVGLITAASERPAPSPGRSNRVC
jgi:hypothetical protein